MSALVAVPGSRWFRWILVVTLFVVTVMAIAAPTARKIEELNFAQAEIPVVLKALAVLSGSNIVVSPAVKGAITVRLKDVTVEEALQIIAKQADLTYALEDGTYVVSAGGRTAAAPPADYLVLSLKYLTPEAVAPAMSAAFADVKVSAVGAKLVLAGATKRLDAAKAFLTQIDVEGGQASAGKPVDEAVVLKSISAADAVAALTPIFTDVKIAAMQNPQWLALRGEQARVSSVLAFLAKIDVPASRPVVQGETQYVEETYRVKYVVAWQAKEYLEAQFRNSGLSVAFAPSLLGLGNDTRPTGTENSVAATPSAGMGPAPQTFVAKTGWESRDLVLRGPAVVVKQALASLARVDAETPVAEKRCGVKRIFASHAITYLLDRYEARGLVIATAPMSFMELLASKEETTGANKAATVKGEFQVGAVVRRDDKGNLNVSEPIGDFILRGPQDVIDAAVQTLAQIDVGPERVDRIVKLRYLKAADVQKQLIELYSTRGLQIILAPSQAVEDFKKIEGVTGSEGAKGGGGGSEGGSNDKKTDQIADLVLRGPDDVVAQAVQLVAQQDVAPPQVTISTQIVSVVSSAIKNLGIEWSSNGTPSSVTTSFNEQQSGDPLQIGRFVRTPVSLTATLNLLQSANKAKIVNRPTSVVQNGNVSYIHVGDVISYEKFMGYDANGRPIFSIDFINTGITLHVRPLVSPDGTITLNIMSGITDPPTFRKGIASDLPSFRETSSTTVVQVRDGETLVIGGLMQEMQDERRQNVALLSKIPVIGALFRSKRTAPSQTELLIMVTPSVVKPTAAPAQ